MPKVALWRLDEGQPLRLPDHQDFLEKHLESWIERDPSLIMDGLQWVGRQVPLPDGRLDLLGITREGQWVVAELKSGPLFLGALTQALHYGMQIGSMDAEDLLERLNLPDDRSLVPPQELERLRRFARTDPQSPRPLLLLLIGTSQIDALEQGMHFMEQRGLQVPIRIVTFGVFRQPDGTILLARQVEEQDEPQRDGGDRTTSVERVLALATTHGVRDEMDAVVALAERMALKVKAWPLALTINSPSNWRKTLLYFKPEGGSVFFEYIAENFEDAFGAATSEVQALLGRNGRSVPKAEMSRCLAAAEGLLRTLQGKSEEAKAASVPQSPRPSVSPQLSPP